MSTFISLVVVGVCIVATTWLVLRDGGKPATRTFGDHRAEPTDRVARATEAGDRSDHSTGEVSATIVADPPPVPVPEVPAAEPEPAPRPTPLGRQPQQVLAVETTPRHDGPTAVTTATPGPPTGRGARARAPERVRARRRDHVHLGDPDPDAIVLVSPADLPEPQPAVTRPAQRMRAGVSLVIMLVAFGVAAAIVLGVAVILISDFLENAVK